MNAAIPMRLLLALTTTSTATNNTTILFTSSDFPSSKSFKPPPNPSFTFFSSSNSSSTTFSQHSCHSRRNTPSVSNKTWLCRHMRKDQDMDSWRYEEENVVSMFGSDEGSGTQIPTQVQSIELLAIQQRGPRNIGFFGTRNMGFMHQQLIEILSYALVITKNHIYTSGASGTNAAVIRGALRAEKPELLTVILPQSLKKQPPESQELLSKVKTVIEKPHNDHLPLIEASRLCNMDIILHVHQVICFAFHDSRLLMETCQEAKNLRKIVTLFYLD
ncbi:hypothetical protein ACOSQ3_032311 [Xanthoceras sorbifolium]